MDLSKNTKLKWLLAKGNRLSRVEFIFNKGMLWGNNPFENNVDLSDQQSVRCEVTVLFRKSEEQICSEFIREGITGFISGKENYFSNKHKCEYVVKGSLMNWWMKIIYSLFLNYWYNCFLHFSALGILIWSYSLMTN